MRRLSACFANVSLVLVNNKKAIITHTFLPLLVVFLSLASCFSYATVIDSFENPTGQNSLGYEYVLSVDKGGIFKGRYNSNNEKFVHSGNSSYCLSWVLPSGRHAEWIEKLGTADFTAVQDISLWVKPAADNLHLTAGLRDTKQTSYEIPITLQGRDWQQISIPVYKITGIDISSIGYFFLRFDENTRGNIYIDDFGTAGELSQGHKSPEKKLTGPSRETKNETIDDFVSLIRKFTNTEDDQKRIHEMLLHSSKQDPENSSGMTDDEFLDLIERRSFLYFWYEVNPENGLTQDRAKNFIEDTYDVVSNAAVGFMLTAVGIAHNRGWLTYDQAYDRVYRTLKAYRDDIENFNGFYIHFTDFKGNRVWGSEVSSVDTALFLAGVIFCREYFKGTEIEKLADDIYLRVNWQWMHRGDKFCSMGWHPESGFIGDNWNRYCEGLILNVLEIGSPAYPIPVNAWYDMPKDIGSYEGYKCTRQGPLFTYQFYHCWLDFRNKHDKFANYAQNTANATLANRQYCIDRRDIYKTYGPDSWGLTACDHPDGYHPWGAPPGPPGDNGTIAPWAPGSSIPFTPGLSIRALRYMYDTWRSGIWGKYGFCDAYNVDRNWFAPDVIGIDIGCLLLSIENYRSGLVWKYFMSNEYVQNAMKKIGFVDEPRANAEVFPVDLSGDWLFRRGNNSAWCDPAFEDDSWKKIYVPDRFENQLGLEYNGYVWYRKHFTINQDTLDSWKDSRVVVHIGAIDDCDEVYINGKLIGKTSEGQETWLKERVYPVELGIIKPGQDNVIAIKVYDNSGYGGIWMRPVEIGPFLKLNWDPFKH